MEEAARMKRDEAEIDSVNYSDDAAEDTTDADRASEWMQEAARLQRDEPVLHLERGAEGGKHAPSELSDAEDYEDGLADNGGDNGGGGDDALLFADDDSNDNSLLAGDDDDKGPPSLSSPLSSLGREKRAAGAPPALPRSRTSLVGDEGAADGAYAQRPYSSTNSDAAGGDGRL